MPRRAALLATALLVALGGVACGSDDDEDEATSGGEGATKTVAIKAADFAFDPKTIELKAGEKVTFVIDNGDQVDHNLTVDGLGVDQDVAPGRTAQADATAKAGTFAYFCEFHPAQMTGTITVT